MLLIGMTICKCKMISRMKSLARFSIHSRLTNCQNLVFRDKGGIVSVQLADVYSLFFLIHYNCNCKWMGKASDRYHSRYHFAFDYGHLNLYYFLFWEREILAVVHSTQLWVLVKCHLFELISGYFTKSR